MSHLLNRLRGRVYGWFDAKEPRTWQPRTTLAIAILEDRVMPSFSPYQVPTHFLADTGNGPLSAPMRGTPTEIATSYLNAHAADFGLSVADLAGMTVTSVYTDEDTGLGHVYLRQQVNGLEVTGADFAIGINRAGQVITAGGGFVPNLAAQLNMGTVIPQLTPSEAVLAAAEAIKTDLGLALKAHAATDGPQTFMATNNRERSSWVASEISRETITARLHYVPTEDGAAVLAWNLNIQTLDNNHWFDLSIDAANGELRMLSNWIDDANYHSVPVPNEHPNDGGTGVIVDPQLAAASPFGWHDTNGVAGPEFTTTRGNNVDAHLDRDNNNAADTNPPRPDGGSALDFSGNAFDAGNGPLVLTNQNAAVSNLFYANNVIHDISYQYGFTPAAGNFQINNYGLGGSGNDAVQADAQDGGGTNNANFGTPPDGSAPRMQMYVWTAASPDRDSDMDNGIIFHEYGHGISNRLTGGPANSNALNATQSGGMGEGWSDFFGIMLTQKPTDTQNTSTPVGNYSNNSTNGIRIFPYSFNMTTNPLQWDSYGSGTTSSGITRSTAVHRTGTIWCSTLWDMNWLLINKYGFDSNLNTGWSAVPGPANAGNKLALRLVMDGMKLQPALPSFTQARDAILAADTALTGGANHLQIWTAFARRGLGEGAAVVASSSTTTIVNDTTIPTAVLTLQVVSQTPADLSVVSTPPTVFTLNVSEPLDALSVQAADFTVNGIAANSVAYTAGSTTVTFTFTASPVTLQGFQTMQLNAGAVTRASDANPIQAFAASFRYDAVAMTVTSTSPATGSTQLPVLTLFDVNLSEAVDPASVSNSDLLLKQGFATAFTLLNGNTTIRYTIAGFNSEVNQTVTIRAGAFSDLNGNPSAAFTGASTFDHVTRTFPGAFTAVAPLGSAVYEGSATGLINSNADTDDFTIALDAGQVLTAIITPSAILRPAVTILAPGGATLGTVSGTVTGQILPLSNVPIATAGVYTIRVGSSAAGTNGTFSLLLRLNGINETETLLGTANNTTATAQSLDASLASTTTALGTARRGTAIGITDTNTVYTAAATTFAYEDISANVGVNTLLTNVDDASESFNIPFAFEFYGTEYSTVFVSDNGLITFGSGTTSNTNSSLTTTPTQATIAVLWDDLETGSAGIKWQVLGTAGSRRVVVQWQDASYFGAAGGNPNTLQFQAILYEGTNEIRLNYNDLNGSVSGSNEGQSATVGVKNSTSTARLLLAQNVAGSTFHGTGKSTLIAPPVDFESDFYSFTGTAGQTVAVAANETNAGALTVQLLASDGTTVLATSTPGATNFSTGIAGFILPTSGTHFVAIHGSNIVIPYTLQLAVGTAIDAEANYTAATAQPLGSTRAAAGYVTAANDDWYSYVQPAGTNGLKLETATPGGGSGEFNNTVDPLIRVYDATGTTLLATGTALADGRNEALTLPTLAVGTTYAIRVSSADSAAGEYVLTAQTLNLPPAVQGVTINNGDVQRSRILTLAVAFTDQVSLPANAFTLTKSGTTLTSAPGGGILVAVTAVGPRTIATLTFDSAVAGVQARSLADGNWILTVNAAGVTSTTIALPMSTNFTQTGIKRLFGDLNGDATVDGNDLSIFGNVFNTVNVAADFDDGGSVDGSDLLQFGNRFGLSL